MPPAFLPTEMEVLSPRSANIPVKTRVTSKKMKAESNPKPEEKPSNPDRIDEKWRPPPLVAEPGSSPETYIIGKKLGKGGFAVCFEGKTSHTSELFALKVVKARIEQKKMLEKFRTELQIHAKMQHPNIVEFHKAFTFEDHTYVILQLCENGNLTDMVKARGCLSVPEVRRFMIQICGGVKYMHKRNVIHRDLKMGNVFLDAHMNIKIGDFGLAAVVADDQDRRTTLCGTPNYIAPEILSKSSSRGHDNKVDTWAIGVICYAMLMGTPPFQSKTQQEIYSKLKTLEYEWKIDSKNYITPWAKSFVASCLTLNSAERPEMDDLVEHDFFKCGGVIADVLEPSCLKTKPIWLLEADPRGDKTMMGYGISHSLICDEAGVGRLSNGRPRAAAGRKGNTPALFEIEIENRQGCAPVIPLPPGVLYKQMATTSAELAGFEKESAISAQPRGRKTPIQALKGGSVSSSVTVSDDIEVKPNAVVAAFPARTLPNTRSIQSFAAQQRQQALPTRTASKDARILKENMFPTNGTDPDAAVPTSRGYLRERPLRAATVRNMRSKQTEIALEIETSSSQSKKMSSNLVSLHKGAETVDDEIEIQRKGHTRTSSQDSSTKRSTSRTLRPAERAMVHAVSSSSSNSAKITTESNRNGNVTAVESVRFSKAPPEKSCESATASSQKNTCSGKPRLIASSDPYTILPQSSLQSTLTMLRSLHDALSPSAGTFSRVKRAHTRSRRHQSNRPRVDKWVDYSTRHGIAYILSDHTVGLVLKSNEDNSKASACVVMRDGKSYTIRRAKGLEGQIVPQDRKTGLEFYERGVTADGDPEDGLRGLEVASKKFRLDLSRYSDSSAALVGLIEGLKGCEAERAKVVGLLDKFGKYMNKVSDGELEDETDDVAGKKSNKERNGIFVDFYQRLGNVGVWGFRSKDGEAGLQFNFPDHTKMVVYQDDTGSGEWMVDVVHLDAGDAKQLSKGGGLTVEAFERRALMTKSIGEILSGGDSGGVTDAEEENIRANEMREKMAWIRGVVGCWVKNGGMGCTGEDKIGWSGLQEKRDGSRVKLCWVTVGKIGGDGGN